MKKCIALALAPLFTACVVPSEPEDATEQDVLGLQADLVEFDVAVAVSGPLAIARGSSLNTTDTTRNQGDVTTGKATLTRFWLSPDHVSRIGGPLGTRNVPILPPSTNSTGPTTLVVPAGIPDGDYNLIACADAGLVVKEYLDTNNCGPAYDSNLDLFVAHLESPDVVFTALSDPPTAIAVGQSFDVTDTAANHGGAATVASVTRYYLSTNGIAKTKQIGTRTVAAQSGHDDGLPVATSVKVPSGTMSGTYVLLACADVTNLVLESDENNCVTSGSVTVSGSNLVEVDASMDVSTVSTSGTVNITETTQNIGDADASTSRTKFFLSDDAVKSAYDWQLLPTCTYPWFRAIGTLAMGAGSTATTPTHMCYREIGSTVVENLEPGSWHVLACADETAIVAEQIETDNCTDAGLLTVTN